MTAPDGVRVSWHPSDEDPDPLLKEQVADLLHIEPADVRVGRHCGRCGADTHGRPWVLVRDADDVWVSLSRSGPHLVTALSTRGPVGVDVESVDDVDSGWDPGLVLHPSEDDADTAEGRTALWCRKEAILKATGDGLDVPMTRVRVSDHEVTDLSAPDGHRAAYALSLGALRTAGSPAGPGGATAGGG